MDKTKPCVWCRRSYDEHADVPNKETPILQMPCKDQKSHFSSEKTTSPVRKLKTEQVTMTFGEALDNLSAGAKITRIEWNNVEEYGQLYMGWLMIYRNNKYNVWQVSDGDILANDWIILPDSN